MAELSERERAVLDFEREWWVEPAGCTKAESIRRRLSISSASYYALLDRLADSAAAFGYDPLVVRRLQRRRAARRRALLVGEQPRRRRPH
ncbi:MAG TPA: DUF3263 domain-containing protein [Acidimicrobiales bacterium]|nr:DUF3263 domain-containing protein [Acidimicrobiales bacterium]